MVHEISCHPVMLGMRGQAAVKSINWGTADPGLALSLWEFQIFQLIRPGKVRYLSFAFICVIHHSLTRLLNFDQKCWSSRSVSISIQKHVSDVSPRGPLDSSVDPCESLRAACTVTCVHCQEKPGHVVRRDHPKCACSIMWIMWTSQLGTMAMALHTVLEDFNVPVLEVNWFVCILCRRAKKKATSWQFVNSFGNTMLLTTLDHSLRFEAWNIMKHQAIWNLAPLAFARWQLSHINKGRLWQTDESWQSTDRIHETPLRHRWILGLLPYLRDLRDSCRQNSNTMIFRVATHLQSFTPNCPSRGEIPKILKLAWGKAFVEVVAMRRLACV